jgi:ribonuclease G
MRDYMRKDKAKTQVLPISQLGLMEMTRQRLHESLNDSIYDPCPYCTGSGQVKSTESLSVELQRRLNSILQRYPDSDHDLLIVVHPELMQRLRTKDEVLLVEMQRKHRGRLSFRADPTFHREQVTVTNAVTNKEMK